MPCAIPTSFPQIEKLFWLRFRLRSAISNRCALRSLRLQFAIWALKGKCHIRTQEVPQTTCTIAAATVNSSLCKNSVHDDSCSSKCGRDKNHRHKHAYIWGGGGMVPRIGGANLLFVPSGRHLMWWKGVPRNPWPNSRTMQGKRFFLVYRLSLFSFFPLVALV